MGFLQLTGLRRENQWQPLTLLDHLLSSPLALLVTLFYRLVLFLRGKPFHPPPNKSPIRVVCISDTHDNIVSVPRGDILIHAGDLTNDGTVKDIQKQIDWLKSQPHAVKVVVAGNHDSWFDEASRPKDDVATGAKVNLDGVDYLESTGIIREVRGRKVYIFGVPDIPECGPSSFAFQYKPASHPWMSKVPPQTDILITHCPPKHHLDLSLGDSHLLRELYRVKPRLHVFGHVHSGYGTEAMYFDDLQVSYEQFLSKPRRGPVWDFVPNGQWLDVLTVLGLGLQSVAWKWIMGGPKSNHGSLAVNAGQMDGRTNRIKDRAVVVDI